MGYNWGLHAAINGAGYCHEIACKITIWTRSSARYIRPIARRKQGRVGSGYVGSPMRA
jgi:hypothetical protein